MFKGNKFIKELFQKVIKEQFNDICQRNWRAPKRLYSRLFTNAHF